MTESTPRPISLDKPATTPTPTTSATAAPPAWPSTPPAPVGHDLAPRVADAPAHRAPVQLPPAPSYQPAPLPPMHLPPHPAPAQVAQVTTVAPQSNAEIVVAWIATAVTLLYMLPWAVAASRRSTNSVLIAVATFFLAWTGIGWLVLLVLSFLGPTVYSVQGRTTTFVALPPAPQGMWAQCPTDPPYVRRWWDGHAWTAHTQQV